jgi:RNA polymerase sigma factor (sigma-70 family)
MENSISVSAFVGTVYEKGVELSRNFKKRTSEQTSELYRLIKQAVMDAQDPQHPESDKALLFITVLFDPLVKKVSSRIYPFVSKYEEFEDVLQETYAAFINLVYQYNPLISSFPYYVNNMLPKQVKAWSQKTRKKASSPIDVTIVDNRLVDPMMDSKDTVYDKYNGLILEKEYEEFILKRAEKKAKSGTVKEVCYSYFLGGDTCSQIAERLNISYHAVYEVIKRIEKELRKFLEEDSFTGFSISDLK